MSETTTSAACSPPAARVSSVAVFRPVQGRPSFDITRGPAGEWIVTGEAVERLFLRWDMENEEAAALV